MNNLEDLLLRYFDFLDEKGKAFNLFVGIVCTVALGVFDLITPVEFQHTYLYLLPIAFVTWFSGMRLGLVVALGCTAFWSIHNVTPSLIISSWNIVTTALFYLLIAALLKKTRIMWENEKKLSRTDPLTGAKNMRAFTVLVEHEILRSQRDSLPFSLAYLDLDNFKAVNDTYGHATGDNVLTSVVSCIAKNLRKTDVVGRLGGDEFAIFFPETDQAAVQVVMLKVRLELTRLMESSRWPTTFSVGVVTCCGGVHDFNRLINYADSLMYEVKRTGKNNIRYVICPPAAGAK